MKRYFLILLFALACAGSNAQTINAAYVKALYKKYPTQKSDFCPSGMLWVNPYYRSLADTDRHMPLVTYYIYTKPIVRRRKTLMFRGKAFTPPGTPLMASRTKPKSINKRTSNRRT